MSDLAGILSAVMNARIGERPIMEVGGMHGVQRCLVAALPDGIARAAIEHAAQQVLDGCESLATVRAVLHRYRDAGRIDDTVCKRVVSMLET